MQELTHKDTEPCQEDLSRAIEYRVQAETSTTDLVVPVLVRRSIGDTNAPMPAIRWTWANPCAYAGPH